MAAGRPRLPTAQKKAQGTNRKHRENKNEPNFGTLCATTPPPKYFNKYSVEMWNHLLNEYNKNSIIQNTDIYSLEMLCLDFGFWKDAEERIANNPSLAEYETNGGCIIPSILLQRKERARKNCESIMSKFGLTPSDRSRLGLTKENDDNPDTKKIKELVGA